MAEDWAADVKKYVADADDNVIAAIVRHCGIALRNRDSSLVSFSDPKELDTVRENFLKKKLGLTQPDDMLDQGIATVGQRMKGDSTKNRVTVYYLLADYFGRLDIFGGVAKVGGTAGAAMAGAGAAALGGVGDGVANLASPAARLVDPEIPEATGGSLRWLWWLLAALLLLALLWWLFFRHPLYETTPPAPVATNAPAPAAEAPATLDNAPAEGTVAIPTGAGVTTELRDGKPVVKVYFDTGKTDVAPAFAAAAAGLKTYLASHAGTSLAVSGFNDPTGNAALNAELSKNRAKAVAAELTKAGIADSAVTLEKPAAPTDTTTSNAQARRVEVVVK